MLEEVAGKCCKLQTSKCRELAVATRQITQWLIVWRRIQRILRFSQFSSVRRRQSACLRVRELHKRVHCVCERAWHHHHHQQQEQQGRLPLLTTTTTLKACHF